jgi:hypothetical protein
LLIRDRTTLVTIKTPFRGGLIASVKVTLNAPPPIVLFLGFWDLEIKGF